MHRREQSFESVEGAVAEATRLQAEEGYDLFRGQRRPWPIVSTFRRLALDRQPEALVRLNQFIHWAKQEPALLPYEFTSDQALAVAQHYGIPTTFMDFTTDIEVARHFATEPSSDDDRDNANQTSCIVALQSAALEKWVAPRFEQTSEFVGPEIVRIDVANLWRLEAQSGVFLVDDELLDAYPFAYLLFPAPISAGAWDKESVYPKDKSDLELIVEQWFWHEKASAGTRHMHELLRQGGIELNVLKASPTDGIGLKGIIRPRPHPSWSGREGDWTRDPERFEEARPRSGDVFELPVRSGMDLDAISSLVAEQVPLSSLSERRARSADWRVVVDGCVQEEVSAKLKRQWDALRIDGYSDAQVVESFVRSASLAMLQLGHLASWPSYDAALSGKAAAPLMTLFGCDLLVEFCGLVGYGRAQICAADLRAAVRDDIDRYLPADLYQYTGPTKAERMKHLLIGIHQPNLLFDFDRFADIYVRQVIPMSVIFRPELPLYPVLQLTTFGVP